MSDKLASHRANSRGVLALLTAAIFLSASGCSGCLSRGESTEGAVQLDGQFAGCVEVSRGPVCGMGEVRRLRVWFPLAKTVPVRFSVDGAAVAPAAVEAVEGGTRHELELGKGASRVDARASMGAALGQWTLRVADVDTPTWLVEARELRAAGNLDGAEERLKEGLGGDHRDRARALGLRARIALMRAKQEDTKKAFDDAIAADRASGLVSNEGDDACAESFMLSQLALDYGPAREMLDRSADAFRHYPEGRAREPYYRGLIAGQTGDVRTALELLREAGVRASRLGMSGLVRDTLEATATQLFEAGRHEDALEALERVERGDGEHAPPCSRANLDNNIGFAILASATRRTEPSETQARLHRAKARLERASSRYRTTCPDASSRANVLVDLALTELALGDAERAAQRLKESRQTTENSGLLALWWLELDGRIALARGDAAQALVAFEHASALAQSMAQARARWAAEVGRATALERLNRLEQAVEAAARAETILDGTLAYIPLGEGRAAFLGEREKSARLLIDLLSKLGRNREAFAAVRASRTRLIDTARIADRVSLLSPLRRKAWEDAIGTYRRQRELLEEESAGDWRLAEDQLRAVRTKREQREADMRRSLESAMAHAALRGPEERRAFAPAPPGVLLLAYHPLRDGWIAFGVDSTVVNVKRLERVQDSAPTEELARQLLSPFAAQVKEASRIRVLPYGDLRFVDFHALPWNGEALVRHAVVEYPLDLGMRLEERPRDRERLAVVVGDPAGDLPASYAEAEKVAAVLRSNSGFRVRTLLRQEANRQSVALGMTEAVLFHFAGHGAVGTEEGWTGALRLADRGRLLTGDVLAYSRVPRWVVLSACEGARGYGREGAEGLGLGQAFLLAGSEVTISSTRPVRDVLAAKISLELYDTLNDVDEFDGPAALRSAQIAVQDSDSGQDWAAFRALTR